MAKIASLYSTNSSARLVRPDEKIDVSTNEAITKTSRDWLDSIQYLNSMTILDAAYHVFEGGNMVYAQGHVSLNVVPKDGPPGRDFDGQFIRVYTNEEWLDESGKVSCDPKGTPVRRWHLAFDYATTPMPIGCEPGGLGREGEHCPPNEVGRIDFARVVEPSSTPSARRRPRRSTATSGSCSYQEFVDAEVPVSAGPERQDPADQPRQGRAASRAPTPTSCAPCATARTSS